MGIYLDYDEIRKYTAELKQLLSGGSLTADTRARALASLIEADAMADAAQKIHSAAQTTLGDTMTLVLQAVESFRASARDLGVDLHRLPDR